jgi:hypothetical protein
MVHIHCAYTEQINPEGSDPILSRDQVGILNASDMWRDVFFARC